MPCSSVQDGREDATRSGLYVYLLQPLAVGGTGPPLSLSLLEAGDEVFELDGIPLPIALRREEHDDREA